VLEALQDAFGHDVLNRAGELNRALLAERAFESPEACQKLNEICWPAVRERLADLLIGKSCQPRNIGNFVVVEIPLLVEAPELIAMADEIISVEADEAIRVLRAVARGMTVQDAKNRIDLQASDAERSALAHHVFDNNGSLEQLMQQVDAWYTQVQAERLF
jgi:dephospho-CoA kinase